MIRKFDTQLDALLTRADKISKQAIADYLNVGERAARDRISEHRFTVPVLQSPYEEGYRKPLPIDEIQTMEEAQLEYIEVLRCINELERKKDIFNKQERPLIAYAITLKKEFSL